MDITNNHHPNYYRLSGIDTLHPPGDWENPTPVYFLAVAPQTTFLFAVAKRRATVSDTLVTQARQWLVGGLCALGAGAKTNAGYGVFKAVEDQPDVPAMAGPTMVTAAPTMVVFETVLTLRTPAFLAGAQQQQADCHLRAATLRGQLRWWWRTLHAGFLSTNQLRDLEAALWGDTAAGSAVQVVIEPDGRMLPQRYDKRSKANFSDQQKTGEYGIPSRGNLKTITQGLWYLSYGMDEAKGRRFYLEPGATWRLRLKARPTALHADRKRLPAAGQNVEMSISAAEVMEQAQAALWLLCRFGGVGAKARKGFGSLATPNWAGDCLENYRQKAKDLRTKLALPTQFDEAQAASLALEQMLPVTEVNFNWPDVWQVLDQIGFAYQTVAKQYAHQVEKKALGLPRAIGKPVKGSFKASEPVTNRHASPVHIHLNNSNGEWLVRVAAFPAAKLPNLKASRDFLTEFLGTFGEELRRRAHLKPLKSGRSTSPGIPLTQPTPTNLPRSGERVEAVLPEEKTKKGGWKAKHEVSGLVGPIQNTNDVPGDKQPGDRLTLIVASANERNIAFRFPTPDELQRAAKPQAKPHNQRGRLPERSRR